MTGKQFQLLLLLSYLLQSLSLVIFALTLSCSLSLFSLVDSWGHWTVHRIIIAVPWQVSNSDADKNDDDRDADDVMMMIDVFHLTHSITHTLSHYLLQSLSFFLSLLCFALTLSCSLSPTCRFLRSLDSPSDDHCCPMSGKQFRWCCSSDDDEIIVSRTPANYN